MQPEEFLPGHVGLGSNQHIPDGFDSNADTRHQNPTAPAPAQPMDRDREYLPSIGKVQGSEKQNCLPGQDDHDSISFEAMIPDEEYANLDELAAPLPVENFDERRIYRRRDDLEEVRSGTHHDHRVVETLDTCDIAPELDRIPYLTHLMNASYLILFAIMGTLGRLGLVALTKYPGAPIIIPGLWPNFAGCVVMGYLGEDRLIFQQEWAQAEARVREGEVASAGSNHTHSRDSRAQGNRRAAEKYHEAAKKTAPLFIGLTVGFCGSLTSFSSFLRDTYFALSNSLGTATAGGAGSPRNNGDSVMAVLAVILLELCLCIGGLKLGAHIAIGSRRLFSTSQNLGLRRCMDFLAIILAWGCWLGAIIISIWPPDRSSRTKFDKRRTESRETWRGQVLFALVFAPLGCLVRFHISLLLNGKLKSFPLGTFLVNVSGTMILGVCWDLQHIGSIGGGRVGCQVLNGVQDGFCGCLTTVSTWVLELTALRRKHAYFYGAMSVVVAFSILCVVVGPLQWTDGLDTASC